MARIPKWRPKIGDVIGSLVIIEDDLWVQTSKGRQRASKCRCKCGNVTVYRNIYITQGLVKSCGCERKMHAKKHGHRYTPEYKAWQSAKQRCTNPADARYADYGGRGIKFYPLWKDSFETFLIDMGYKPGPGYSLDRIDNNGNYEPNNCRWATNTDQQNNKRNTDNMPSRNLREIELTLRLLLGE